MRALAKESAAKSGRDRRGIDRQGRQLREKPRGRGEPSRVSHGPDSRCQARPTPPLGPEIELRDCATRYPVVLGTMRRALGDGGLEEQRASCAVLGEGFLRARRRGVGRG